MTITRANIDACQEALYLLRQDVQLPSEEDADSDASVEWLKCRFAFDAAIAEVWSAHDWAASLGLDSGAAGSDCASWSQPMAHALAYCIARELAVPLAGRVQDLQNWDAVYRSKLARARVAALEMEMAGMEDGIDLRVVKLVSPHYRETDEDLPRSVASLVDRIHAQTPAAVDEVWNAHGWMQAYGDVSSDDAASWPEGMKDVLVHLLGEKLCMPVARHEGDTPTMHQLYAEKLARARVAALESELASVKDPLHVEVLRILVPRFDPSDATLPRSVRSITLRADVLCESARYAVLTSHAWNFARADDPTPSCAVPRSAAAYPFASAVPAGCVHLEAVYGDSGALNDWKLSGDTVVSMQPVRGCVYTRDDARPMKWPPLVRRAFLLRLASDVAQTEFPAMLADMERRFQEALAEAKVRDSRESNTPRDAWGRNHYADAMAGRAPGMPRPPRHAFHGLV